LLVVDFVLCIHVVVLAVLGVIDAAIYTHWVGIYTFIVSAFVLILELPWAPFAFMATVLTYPHKDFRWRIGFYIL
jgi:hypothetical protein